MQIGEEALTRFEPVVAWDQAQNKSTKGRGTVQLAQKLSALGEVHWRYGDGTALFLFCLRPWATKTSSVNH